MSTLNPEDLNLQTALHKDGDPLYKQRVCQTLREAALEVARWPDGERHKARFAITGKDKGYIYTWADIEPHLDRWPPKK